MLTVTTSPQLLHQDPATAGVSILFAGDCFHLADAAVLHKQRAEGDPLSSLD